MIAWLSACGGPVELDDTGGTTTEPVTGYELTSWIDPDPPVAGQTGEFWIQVLDQLGRPIPDLQQSHERMIHTIFVSRDLESFQHVHHEDFQEISVDDLRESTFHFPVAFPAAGEYREIFDYAHHNVYQKAEGWLTVEGDPPQLAAPVVDLSATVAADDVVVDLAWVEAPVVGFLASWTFHLETPTGDPVTDLVMWLGADAHVALVSEDLAFTSHTHAWVPGIDNMSPSMQMPHVYDGPDVTFQYTFSQPGLHKMWLQFARSAAPDRPYAVPFWFEVSP